MKDIIIIVLLFTSAACLHKLNQDRREMSSTTLIPSVKYIDWPEELAPSILDDSTFTATLRFKMKGPDSLSVQFVPQLRLINH
jgi:hypothetical protein